MIFTKKSGISTLVFWLEELKTLTIANADTALMISDENWVYHWQVCIIKEWPLMMDTHCTDPNLILRSKRNELANYLPTCSQVIQYLLTTIAAKTWQRQLW